MAVSDFPSDYDDDYDGSGKRPRVAIRERSYVMPLAVLAAVGLGGVVFWQLSQGRTRVEQSRLTDPIEGSTEMISTEGVPPPPLIQVSEPVPSPVELPPVVMALEPVVDEATLADDVEREARLKSPALVVDLGDSSRSANLAAEGMSLAAGAVSQALLPGAKPNAAAPINGDELFAQRLGFGETTEPAMARAMANPEATVPEGSVIPAVLETAINSDLPGYTRALVSRDVRGFDGQSVLIPRGSRLIGQYRSGVALGQSRAFVIWTRLIRPDGATIELAAPGADALGRGGLEGDVDRHFFQRFGSSILFSLIDAGIGAVDDDSDTQVIVSQGRALGEAALAERGSSFNISPTITVPQGAPIRVIVTRDLDFSAVGAMNE
jgi:type IV secretion system protein VirB10